MLTTRDAADRLGIKPRSVIKAIERGLIKAEKRGRDYWIENEEIERYARERRPAHRPKRGADMNPGQKVKAKLSDGMWVYGSLVERVSGTDRKVWVVDFPGLRMQVNEGDLSTDAEQNNAPRRNSHADSQTDQKVNNQGGGD